MQGIMQDRVDKIEKICNDLEGTCESLEHVLNLHDLTDDDLTDGERDQLDQTVFNCEICGWWYEIGESNESIISGDNICHSCFSEECEDGEEE